MSTVSIANTSNTDSIVGALNQTSEGTLSNQIDEAAERKWAKQAESVLLDFNSTESDVIEFLLDSMQGGKFTEFRSIVFQRLMDQASRMKQMITNLLATMQRTSESVIRNIGR